MASCGNDGLNGQAALGVLLTVAPWNTSMPRSKLQVRVHTILVPKVTKTLHRLIAYS